jgi:hypothetical protein
MSVLTFPAQPGQDAGRAVKPVPWRRMIWVTWAQHRAMLISLTAVLGAVVVFLIAVGLYVHHSFSVLMACRPSGSPACQALNRSFNTTDWTIANTLLVLMTFAPALIGAFTGATVVARELETGTFRYAWTQGIGRVRWTIAKLALLGAAITVLTWALSQVFSWFYAPILQQQDSLTLLSATVFVTHGIAFAAWCLMAFTLGAFLGMLLRRVVGAMAATLGVYLGLGVVTWVYLRPHYPVALVTSNPSLFNDQGVPGPGDSFPGAAPGNAPWVLSTWNVGHAQWWRYIPVSRFWPMQLIEGGWLLALSIILIVATVWLARRRAV